MASVHPEAKGIPPWGWIIGAVAVIIVIIAVIGLITGEPEPDEPLPDPDAPIAQPVAEVQDYSEWVQQEMAEYQPDQANEMAADGFDRIADAIEALSDEIADRPAPATPPAPGAQEQEPVQQQLDDEMRQEFEVQIDTIRANADNLRDDDEEPRHAEYARSAATATTEVLRQLQDRYYPLAVGEIQRMDLAVQNIEEGVPLDEQRQALEEFFRATEQGLLAMEPRDIPRDPRDQPGELPGPPDPDDPDAGLGAPPPADAPGN